MRLGGQCTMLCGCLRLASGKRTVCYSETCWTRFSDMRESSRVPMSDPATERRETLQCEGCGEPIEDDETAVYSDTGAYHMGCEFDEVYSEVGSGGFSLGK